MRLDGNGGRTWKLPHQSLSEKRFWGRGRCKNGSECDLWLRLTKRISKQQADFGRWTEAELKAPMMTTDVGVYRCSCHLHISTRPCVIFCFVLTRLPHPCPLNPSAGGACASVAAGCVLKKRSVRWAGDSLNTMMTSAASIVHLLIHSLHLSWQLRCRSCRAGQLICRWPPFSLSSKHPSYNWYSPSPASRLWFGYRGSPLAKLHLCTTIIPRYPPLSSQKATLIEWHVSKENVPPCPRHSVSLQVTLCQFAFHLMLYAIEDVNFIVYITPL